MSGPGSDGAFQTARNSNNPFSMNLQSPQQHKKSTDENDIPLVSQEYDLERPQIESDLLSESKRMLMQMQREQQEALEAEQ